MMRSLLIHLRELPFVNTSYVKKNATIKIQLLAAIKNTLQTLAHCGALLFFPELKTNDAHVITKETR